MIFAVLEDWYHHIVLTHSCKLVSFLHIILNSTELSKAHIPGSPMGFSKSSSPGGIGHSFRLTFSERSRLLKSNRLIFAHAIAQWT